MIFHLKNNQAQYKKPLNINNSKLVNPREPIHSAIDLGSPVKPIDNVKKAPPAKMNAIMQEVLVAPKRLSVNAFKFNEP